MIIVINIYLTAPLISVSLSSEKAQEQDDDSEEEEDEEGDEG